jgi:hypothetical protein
LLRRCTPAAKQGNLVGEILGQVALFVESDDEGAVVAGTDDVLQKSGGGFFFKSKAALHRAAHVHEQPEFDGQVGLAAEVEDRLHRLVVVENGEIVLVQIADELAVAIGRDEKHVDFIDAFLDGEDGWSARRWRNREAAALLEAWQAADVGTCLGASGTDRPKNGDDRRNDYDESRIRLAPTRICRALSFFRLVSSNRL